MCNEALVKFKKVDPRAQAPVYGTSMSAGADLRIISDEPVTILPGETATFHTGLAVAIPSGLVGLIYCRSGLACKHGLALANKVGVIDADYRGEIMVVLRNESNDPQTVEPNERVAQMVITPFYSTRFCKVDDLDSTIRGGGGFGSTGTK